MVSRIFVVLLVPFVLGLHLWVENAEAQDSSANLTREKKMEEEEEQKGNIYNFIFGSAPSMPTERGLLVLHAFHDLNRNMIQDPGEEFLRNEVVCLVDGIRYRVPAFIPALKLHQNYVIRCSTDVQNGKFRPLQDEEEIFVERRGQVFDIGVACESAEPGNAPPAASPSTPPGSRP